MTGTTPSADNPQPGVETCRAPHRTEDPRPQCPAEEPHPRSGAEDPRPQLPAEEPHSRGGAEDPRPHRAADAPQRPTEEPRASIPRQIVALALPALGALVAQPLFTVIDSAMVGHLGTPELAGLGIASTVLNTVVGVFVFLAYSTTAIAGRALGAGRPDRAIRGGVEAMWLAAGLGLVAAAALSLGADPLLRGLGADALTLPHASAYLRWSSPGLVGMFVAYAATGTLRGLQDTRTPLIAATAGAAFNACANWALMYPLGMGVAGSGLGTALTQTLMAAFLVAVVVRGARRERVPLRPSTSGVLAAALDGAPLLVRTIALRAALLATLATVTAIGTQALAAHQIVWTLWTFAAYVLDALAIAAQALVGFAEGRGDRGGMAPLLRTLARWGTAFGALVGVVLGAASPWLPALFTADPAVRGPASWAIVVGALFQPLAGLVFLLDGILIGAGRGRFLAAASLVNLALYAPLLWLIARSSSTGALAGSPAVALALVWAAYGAVYTGARAVTNAWGTWFGRAALVRG